MAQYVGPSRGNPDREKITILLFYKNPVPLNKSDYKDKKVSLVEQKSFGREGKFSHPSEC